MPACKDASLEGVCLGQAIRPEHVRGHVLENLSAVFAALRLSLLLLLVCVRACVRVFM
jgi:hypothetical protein